MEALFNVKKQPHDMDFRGWLPVNVPVPGAGPSYPQMHAGSMDPVPLAHTSNHQHKRYRLFQLLDKLAVQLNNNNNNSNNNYNTCPTPPWLVVPDSTPQFEAKDDEVPLDLSLKSKPVLTTPAHDSFHCTYCGASFAVHDRLIKHIASRHRNKSESVRAYECEVCYRKFARSDMLTRHARLHSGLKPYSCASCGQVFSRSDHLATHQRTHTGEKPYRCPSCPYAACRRDMITRHMRTHVRRAEPAPA